MNDRLPGIRPRPSLARWLDIAARVAIPATTTALLMLLAGAPWSLPGQASIQLGIALGCVFFWSLFRPASMPPVAVFALGVLADLLQFSPPGVNVLMLLTAHGVARRWRRKLARQSFVIVWLAFVTLACVTSCLSWLLADLLSLGLYPPGTMLLQAGVTAGLYPVLAMPLTRLHRTAAEPGLA